MLLFLCLSCEQEEIMDIDSSSFFEQQKSSKSKNISKLSNEQLIEQIVDLKNGTKKAYHKYNKKHPNQNFNTKFGKPIVKDIKYIQFVDDDNIIMILPLEKKNNNKSKLLAAYYKNGKKTYKVFTNKKYKRNDNESVSERNLLNNLDLLFITSSYNTILNKSDCSTVDLGTLRGEYYAGGSYCWEVTYDQCTGSQYLTSCNSEKGDSEIYDEWDEPVDPPADDNTGDVTDYCDSGDPTCDDGGGSTGSDGSDGNDTTNTGDDQISIDPTFDQYPCQKNIVENIRDNSSTLSNFITSAFGGTQTDVNLTYKVEDLENISETELVNAGTSDAVMDSNGELNLTISLDTQAAQEGSDLLIATVMIHENVHALLTYMDGMVNFNISSPNPSLNELAQAYASWKTDNQQPTVLKTEHFYMTQLVDKMADALHEYAENSEFEYLIDPNYYKSLCWSGDMKVHAPESIQSDIDEAYLNERLLAGSSYSQGTKCQ